MSVYIYIRTCILLFLLAELVNKSYLYSLINLWDLNKGIVAKFNFLAIYSYNFIRLLIIFRIKQILLFRLII